MPDMKRNLFFCFLVIFLCLAVGYEIFTLWRGKVLGQKGFTKESLLEAAEVDPTNPEPFYKLGVLHQWNLLNLNVKESNAYLQKAIEKNPLEQDYWLNLAKGLLKMEEAKTSEKALENAISVFPTGYQGRWIAGNLLLQQGDIEKALPHFSYILTYYPNQSRSVYDVWTIANDDPDFMLEKLVPRDPSSLNQYLSYLYETGDKDAAIRAWNAKVSLGQNANRDESLRYVEFLISRSELNEAFRVWKAELREQDLAPSSDNHLITNGGFETGQIAGGGFDWRMSSVPGAEVSLDRSVAFEGKSSMRIKFNGKENVDFRHLYQYASLKPDTHYVLKARMKTKGVTTKSGLMLEVSGVGPAFYGASNALTGDNDWTELTVDFRTPAESQGGIVRVRRPATSKFDRLIAGEVWIDNVQLIEMTSQ